MPTPSQDVTIKSMVVPASNVASPAPIAVEALDSGSTPVLTELSDHRKTDEELKYAELLKIRDPEALQERLRNLLVTSSSDGQSPEQDKRLGQEIEKIQSKLEEFYSETQVMGNESLEEAEGH